MPKMHVTRKGKYYEINGQVVKPDKFYGIDAFKFANHIVAWVNGGHDGKPGDWYLDQAKRYLEHEVIGNGCIRARAPVELMLWGVPYFNVGPMEKNGQIIQPPEPWRGNENVANTLDLVNLNTGTGSNFHLTGKMKKVIRMYVVLGREFGVVFEVPWLWTIKSEADREALRRLHLGDQDPRRRFDRSKEEAKGGATNGVAIWNEHFMAAHGVGAYLQQLYTDGDGGGESRVDPGGLNMISDFMNEYTAHVPEIWNRKVLKNVARRWQERDAPSQPIKLISQSGVLDTYDPPLQSDVGAEGFTGPCTHPPRDEVDGVDWDEAGTTIRETWPRELIDVNEAMMGMTQEQRDAWVPLIPKWAGLGTTNMKKWERMNRNYIDNEIYTTFHTFRGMDAYWPETPQTRVEETVRAITGGQGGNGGGGGPVERPYDRFVVEAYADILERKPDPGGRDAYNDLLEAHYFRGVGGVSVNGMREAMLGSPEYKKKNPLPDDG